MGIPYDPTKPAANDKPTNDQPIMQSNYSSIKTLLNIDHTDFANALYGTHLKVTFGSNNVPSVPTSPPVLFTNTTSVSPVPQLFYYSGTASQGSNQYYINQSTASSPAGNPFTAQGSTMLLGGIIIKWGTYDSPPGDVPRTLTFFQPFPTAAIAITFGSNVTGSAGDLPISQSSINQSGFVIQRVNSSGAGSFRYYIQVIGY